MIEANLYPAIPYLHVQQHDREVTSMSDYAHGGRRSKTLVEHRTIEYRLMVGACYFLSLASAIAARLTPWRRASGQPRIRPKTPSAGSSLSFGSVFQTGCFSQ